MELVFGELITVCIINVILFFIVGGVFITNYNGLIRHAERLKEAWGQIEAQLQRRYDALLAMSRVVQGYTSHEQVIDSVVAKARGLMGTSGLADRVSGSSQAESKVAGFMGHVVNITTSFPELKADKHFQELLNTVQETGNIITQRREDYNKGVSEYNAYLRKYPTKLYAMVLGFDEGQYFGSGVAATGEIPEMIFNQEAAAQGAAVGSPHFPPTDRYLEGTRPNEKKKLPGKDKVKNGIDTANHKKTQENIISKKNTPND